jgi:hypothetical protein
MSKHCFFNQFIISLLVFFCLAALRLQGSQFTVGEKLKYSIYAGGFKVGYQTIEVRSIDRLRNRDVYVIGGKSWTSSFVSIFYRLDDNWQIYVDTKTLLPLRVEKDMREGTKEGLFIYDLDQKHRKITIRDGNNNSIIKTVTANNDVFDFVSMVYFFRENAASYTDRGDTIVFDFLEPKRVRTVSFKNEGLEDIIMPKISRSKAIRTTKFKQIGDTGIEFFVSDDSMFLPLKMSVNAKLPRDLRIRINVYLEKYSSEGAGDYTSLRKIFRSR